jgi:hypothetical protein
MLNTMRTAVNRILSRLLLICFMLAKCAAAAAAGTATLAWSAPATNADSTPLTDLAGYKVYYGTASAQYGTPVDVGPASTYQINTLAEGVTYYFSVTAYNTAGGESGFSSEVSKAIPSSVQYALTTTLTGTGTGSVVSSPVGITCGSACSALYPAGTTVALVAQAAPGSVFLGWSGACTGGTCTVAMDAAKTVAAAFALRTFTLSAAAGANGVISPAGNLSVDYGATRTYTITPAAGYHVSGVLVDGVSVGAVTSYAFTNVTANHTISATFAINTATFAITASVSGNATISPAGVVSVASGTSQTFTIKPYTGYTVSSVAVDGVSVGAVTTYTFTNVSANHTIAATIKTRYYSITPSAGTGGTISPSAVVWVPYGGSKTFTVTPNIGYAIANVVVDGVSKGAIASYTFTNLSAKAHTISAAFSIRTCTITPTAGANGSLSPAAATTVPYGASQAVTITPAPGYHVSDVLVDGVSAGPVASYTFSNIGSDHSISASFAINTYTIMTTARGAGAITPAGPVTANHGGNAVFSISADAGNVITDVLVDGASMGRMSSLTLTNITANHTIEAVIAANLSCPDPGIPCVERVDGQPDGNNLVNDQPKVDVEFEFRAIVADDRGSPRSVKLALAGKADPVPADFTRYDMACTGDFGTGALCTYRTELPPAIQQKFFIEAVLSDGAIATFSPDGAITGPRIDLLTDAVFTVALRPGWNSITNPYRENIELSAVLVRQGTAVPVPWLTAAGNNWLNNALYDFTGSDAGRTSLAAHAGSMPDAMLVPWRTYWVFLNNTDAPCSLIFTKPSSAVTGQ